MSIIHFSTEVSGGAGSVAVNVHRSMLSMGIKSRLITREFSPLAKCTVVVPLTKWRQRFRSLNSKLTNLLRIINPEYALFGVQKFPLKFQEIQSILDKCEPKALIFYWTSYFISYQTILDLKNYYPGVEIFFICLD